MIIQDYSRYGGWMREATLQDLVDLAPRLRQEDKDEILASTGLPSELALPRAIDGGETYVCGVLENDTPEIVLGFIPIDENVATIWMLSTPELFRHAPKFASVASVVIEAAQERWPILTNFIDKRNRRHVHWLRRMEFKFLREVELGPFSLPFLEFVRIKECVFR